MISHIHRTNKALTIYKVEKILLSLCLCVEHREFRQLELRCTGVRRQPARRRTDTRHPVNHLAELDGSRLVVPIAGKRVKIFKKRQDEDPDLDHLDDKHNRAGVKACEWKQYYS